MAGKRLQELEREVVPTKFRRMENNAEKVEMENVAACQLSQDAIEIKEEYEDLEFQMNEPDISLNEKIKDWHRKHKPKRSCVSELIEALKEHQQETSFDEPENTSHDAPVIELMNMQFEKVHETMQIQCQLIDALNSEVKLLRGQLEVTTQTVTEQSAIIKTLLRQDTVSETLQDKFPIQNEEELIQLDEMISSGNKAVCVKAMRNIMQPEGVLKNLRQILSNELVMAYNIEGSQSKKALKNVEHFYGALLEAIDVNSSGRALEHLRRAIQLQKKRIFKNASLQRQREAQNV